MKYKNYLIKANMQSQPANKSKKAILTKLDFF